MSIKTVLFKRLAYKTALRRSSSTTANVKPVDLAIRCWSSTASLEPVDLASATYENSDSQAAKPPFVIAHGLFGSKSNWTSLCKSYSQRIAPSRKVIALDLRNHGESVHSDEHTYHHLVEDVRHFLLKNGIDKITLMGHSMGGRCAMLFALTYPEMLEKLIIVDISPSTASPQLIELPKMIHAMQSVIMPENVSLHQARTMVDQQLAKTFHDKDVRSFILTNLIAKKGSYKWRLNVPALQQSFKNIAAFPAPPSARFNGETLFIGGGVSDYLPYHEASKPKRLVYAIDLRNHGDSPRLNANSYDDLVMDVVKFLETMNLKRVSLVGHDVGGRVGMLIGLKYPELIEKLIISDMSPITTSHSFKVFPAILRTLNSIIFPPNLSLKLAKAHTVNCLSRIVKNKDQMSLVLMNLIQKSDGSYSWGFNNKALLEHFDELAMFPDVYNVKFDGPALFVGGGKSDYLQKSDFPKIQKLFPKAELKYIEGAGHWVHAEKPNEFLKLTLEFLNKP